MNKGLGGNEKLLFQPCSQKITASNDVMMIQLTRTAYGAMQCTSEIPKGSKAC